MQTIQQIIMYLAIILLSMIVLSLISKKTFKETVEITQSIFTVFAIFCGGLWTYMLFNPERDINPHLEIQQNVSSDLAIKDNLNLLSVNLELTNKGNTGLLLDYGSSAGFASRHCLAV